VTRTSSALHGFFVLAAGLAFMAGILLFIGATDTDRYFSWTIDPPLTAAFLGAAYWAALVLFVWAARQIDWARARTALPPVFAIAVLLLIATLVHLEKFDLDSIFGWFWLVVYIAVVPFLAVLIFRQERVAQPPARGERPLPAALRIAVSLQAGALLGIGAALFLLGDNAASIWPWVLSPLTARAIGAFLVGFGMAAAFAVRENDLDRLRGCALAYAALGALELLAVAIHGEDLTGSDLEIGLYVAFCATVLAVGSYGALASGPARRALSASP
jgi:hypothetical protein